MNNKIVKIYDWEEFLNKEFNDLPTGILKKKFSSHISNKTE